MPHATNPLPVPLFKAICPLWSLDDRAWPEFLGSSTLVRFGGAHFLITCAHVMDNAREREVFFLGKGVLVPLAGRGQITNLPPGGSRENDRVDSSFLLLTAETVESMQDLYHFATTGEIAVGIAATSTNYTFVGYPENLAQPRGRGVLRPEERSLTAGAMSEADFAVLGLSKRKHVGIRLTGGPLTDRTGRPTNMPLLNGISGGPVLMHFHEALQTPAVSPKLVGLCMERPPEHPEVMLGVRLTATLEAIRKRYPQLSALIPQDPEVDIVVPQRNSAKA